MVVFGDKTKGADELASLSLYSLQLLAKHFPRLKYESESGLFFNLTFKNIAPELPA